MSSLKLQSSNIFCYNAAYCVLICRECKYAIQKSAVQSHFLRHKIYRNDRQRLISEIQSLQLLEPEEVPIPPPTSPPIDGLAVIPGYRCTVPGCNSLYASVKRMKRHHNDFHKTEGDEASAPSWEATQLQTFFRGTKIKYFQVTVSTHAMMGPAIPTQNLTTKVHETLYEPPRDVEMDEATVDVGLPESPAGSPQLSTSPGIDLNSIFYFNHYLIKSSSGLPRFKDEPGFWQFDVVQLALGRQWLMGGLFAISACHLAVEFHQDKPTFKRYLERAQSYGIVFFAVRDAELHMNAENPEVIRAASKIAALLQCLHWVLDDWRTTELDILAIPSVANDLDPFALVCAIRELAKGSDSISREEQDSKRTAIFAKSRVLLDKLPKSLAEDPVLPGTAENTRLALLERLRVLTFRLSETLGRPAVANDVVATLSAIAALVVCGDMSYTSEDPADIWEAMSSWVTIIPEYFLSMIRRNHPAAVVILGHWTWLIRRAELSGAWCMDPLSLALFNELTDKLWKYSIDVQNLLYGVDDVVA